MKIFENKKGIVTHPVTLFIVGIVLGIILVYLWINYTSVPQPFCPK